MKIISVLLVTAFLFTGCSKNPDDLYSASLLEVQEALNAEDYNRAIEIVEGLPAHKREVIKLKSMAYAGRAGFNALRIADLVTRQQNKSGVVVVYELADKFYAPTAISDVNKALENIKAYYPNIDARPQDINAIYGLVQLYKASQIILKNVKTQSIDTCELVDFLVDDVIDLIYSINSAALSLEKDIQEIRSRTQSLRAELSLPSQENFGQEEVNQVKARLQEVVYAQISECTEPLP